ncbi:hypothetical protein ACFXJO_03785 [Streptomyces lavendulae]|uniref:hypothetical protein n=1 Tax=Streptomyces lavendulae TaxID=1914 RepID=UPI0036764D71
MQNATDDELAVIALQPVEELLPAGTRAVSEAAWEEALCALEREGRSCLPRLLPASSQSLVVTWSASGVFGPLLEACRAFAETGGQQSAELVAQEARTLKSLTSVPHMRHYRQPAPPLGSSPADLFSHERIGMVGNGFLAVPLAELVTATGQSRERGVFSSTVPGPAEYVVLWDHLSAPGLILGGVHLAYADPEYGTTLLHQQLHTAAHALTPGPPDAERQ